MPFHKHWWGVKLMDSLGYVIGVLVGDGSLTKTRDYHYFKNGKQVRKAEATKIVPRFRHTISLQCRDEDFAKAFVTHLKVVTLKKPTFYKVKKYYHVRLTSIEWFHKLKPLKDDLMWIINSSFETKKGFLRGLFDSEASVDKRPRVCLYNKNYDLLVFSQKLLKEFGIESYLISKEKIRGARCSRLYIYKNAREFGQLIGFSIQRKKGKLER